MAIRNTHRVGDYLMTDAESGYVHYASEMVERWDGQFVHHINNEGRHPQEFVKARNDPRALRNVRLDEFSHITDTTFELEVGDITIPTTHNGLPATPLQPVTGKLEIERATP